MPPGSLEWNNGWMSTPGQLNGRNRLLYPTLPRGEVVATFESYPQAQEAVAASSEQYIAALYSYNISKALLARGIGIAEAAARQYLGGVR